MKGIILLLVLCPVRFNSIAQSKVPAREVQIKSALLSAPADKKDGATVYGYSTDRNFILLRKGNPLPKYLTPWKKKLKPVN